MLDTFMSANNRARMRLLHAIGEDSSDSDVKRSFDGHTLNVYNNKTGVGCIVMFD